MPRRLGRSLRIQVLELAVLKTMLVIRAGPHKEGSPPQRAFDLGCDLAALPALLSESGQHDYRCSGADNYDSLPTNSGQNGFRKWLFQGSGVLTPRRTFTLRSRPAEALMSYQQMRLNDSQFGLGALRRSWPVKWNSPGVGSVCT